MSMQTDPELSEEIRRFEEQYSENPDSLVFARLADLHRKAERPERALEILDQGLERHPDYLSAHIVRARCLRTLDRPREAEDVFRHVLELDGENLVALRSLAEMAWERGDGETARDHLRELLQLDPRNEEARDLLVEIRGGPADASGDAEPAPPEDEAFLPGEEAVERADDPSGEEDDPFVAEDDPFAREAGESDAVAADDDPIEEDYFGEERPASAPGDEALGATPDDEFGAAEPDEAPRNDEGQGDREDLIIEPTSSRESFDAGEPERGPGEGVGGRPRGGRFEVEPVETEAEGLEEGAPDEDDGGPAVGPGAEAEELRDQIEELRMQAERETDLSDAEEDLATETLANLYEAQGFYREAVEMYEELAAQRPEDEELRRRLERARDALEEPAEKASPEPAGVPAGEPLGSSADEDEAAASPEPAGGPAAQPARVSAADELRAILRGDASPEGRDAPGS